MGLRALHPRCAYPSILVAVFFLVGVERTLGTAAHAQPADWVPRFERPASGLVLDRPTQAGAFVNVAGRRAAAFGYEHQTFEVWAYPMKVLKDFELAFEVEGYSPIPVPGPDVMTHIEVRPEATTITYTHATFTVRQIMFAPIDEPGIVVLLDIDSARPLRVHGSFRPDLRLMWPAGLMTANVGWDGARDRYTLSVEREPVAAVVGIPGAEDVSMMPYQEEPRDLPATFVVAADTADTRDALLPIVMAGSVEGVEGAHAAYERILASIPDLYRATAAHYRDLLDRTLQLDTPDDRLDRAFAWAKVGMDKGMVTNPTLGTGLLAGYRTSGASERPGFAWFFGRDALWTAFALDAIGDADAVRTALDFLARFQREDGKIPHEISQSAAFIPWFDEYPYPWNSADATPLYIIAHEDRWQSTGDRAYLERHWASIKKAYRFSAGTDGDGDGLLDNIGVGHGWVEGGALYPPQEEIYMQGIWVEAARSLARMAEALGENDLATAARREAEETRAAMEETYWLADRGFYAFGTDGELGRNTLVRESTVLPAVPMWWGTLDNDRAQTAIDALGAGALATDWGTRILSTESDRYDPLSYHNGSVWPLFTGWASMGAYRYTRPHVGYQALMATALLTEQDALGYVTELLSGDYNTAFGRSSHHQIWSEAMVVTPAVRGMLGLAVRDVGRTLRFAPQLPADWDELAVRNAPAGEGAYTIAFRRRADAIRITVTPQEGASPLDRVEIAPALPLDARIDAARVNGEEATVEVTRQGDRQRAEVVVAPVEGPVEVVYAYRPGTDVVVRHDAPAEGATNQGLRVLRSRAGGEALELVVEGRGGRTYTLPVRTPRTVGAVEGVEVTPTEDGAELRIAFAGPAARYVRRTLRLPLGPRK